MNSRLFTQGCPRTISWTCQPFNTCGRWTACSSGGMSSWRPAWGSSPDELTESSSSFSASVKDVTDSPKSVCLRNGEYGHQTKTTIHFHFLHAYFVCVCDKALMWLCKRWQQINLLYHSAVFCIILFLFIHHLLWSKSCGIFLSRAHTTNHCPQFSMHAIIQGRRWR